MTTWGPAIEGETPLPDRSGLKDKSIGTRAQLNAAEQASIDKVAIKYLAAKPSRRTAKFNFAWSLQLHEEMFGDVWSWAGHIRTDVLNIGAPPHMIGERLAQLFLDLAYWDTAWPDRIDQATHLHFKAVQIHPFLNGNGRWARMLANIWLRSKDHALTIWPEDVGILSPIRTTYLAAIRAGESGNLNDLVALHRQYTTR